MENKKQGCSLLLLIQSSLTRVYWLAKKIRMFCLSGVLTFFGNSHTSVDSFETALEKTELYLNDVYKFISHLQTM